MRVFSIVGGEADGQAAHDILKGADMPGQTAMLSITEVARLMQTTPLNTLMHIKRGLLEGVEKDGVWLVERASLEALLARTGGGKASAICAGGCASKHACGGGCG